MMKREDVRGDQSSLGFRAVDYIHLDTCAL